ncbi:MAG TPA: hypothetical protein PKZ97_05425 [Azospirillaceae bacterium]|nr:hypothetical protein [Azospirillaceae bacterium]
MTRSTRTPVALFLFNRPDATAQVMARIAAARPSRLLLVADGPRPSRPDDLALCRAARAAALNVDWPCEVSTLFADDNLGCGRRMATGLDWVFEQAEEAVVFEDDCVPEVSFFGFCDELLERYRHDQRIGVISGYNPLEENGADGQGAADSYFFSRYSQTWGWASWRRVWRLFDHRLAALPDALSRGLMDDVFEEPHVRMEWLRFFVTYGRNRDRLWDYQFSFAQMSQSLLSVIPSRSQVANIGCARPDATNAFAENVLGLVPSRPLDFPLRHPPFVVRSRAKDRRLEEIVYKIAPPRLGPLDEAASAALGVAAGLLAEDRLEEAERALIPRFQRSPDDPEALRLLGLIRLRRGQVNDALSLIWKALAAAPDTWPWLAELARIYARYGVTEVARDVCVAALRLAPAEPELNALCAALEENLRRTAAQT